MVIFTRDGTPWIWELPSENFPVAIEILDLYQALEHLQLLCVGVSDAQRPWAPKMKAAWTETLNNDPGSRPQCSGPSAA